MASEPFELLEFTRVWTDNTPEHGFTTYEDREDVVRYDMQLLFDELKNALNKVVGKLNDKDFDVSADASDVVFTPTAYINKTDVQAAIEYVMSQIAASWAGTISDNTITGAKMVEGAIDTRELHDDAVTEDKLHENSVDYYHIKTDAVRRDAIKNGEVTNDKLAPGVLPNKADLVGGIVNPSQMRLRRTNRLIPYGENSYTLSLGDMSVYAAVSGTDVEGGCSVILPLDSTIPVGFYCFLHCQNHIKRVQPGAGAAMLMPPEWEVESYEPANQNEVLFVVKADAVNWVVLPLRSKIRIEDTIGVQRQAKVIKNIGVPTTEWFQLMAGPGSTTDPDNMANYQAIVARTDSVGSVDFSLAIPKPYVGEANWDYNYEMIQDCAIRMVNVTDTQIWFRARVKPTKKIWYELIVL